MKIFCIIAELFIAGIVNTSRVIAQDNSEKAVVMKRYMVKRSFPEGLEIPLNEKGGPIVRGVVYNNEEEYVVWNPSYVSADKKKTYSIYEASFPEAIKPAAEKTEFAADKITEVSILDPYFYK